MVGRGKAHDAVKDGRGRHRREPAAAWGGPSRPICPRWPHCPTTSCAPSPRRRRVCPGRGRGVRRAGPRRPRRAHRCRARRRSGGRDGEAPHHHRLVGEALAAGKLVVCRAGRWASMPGRRLIWRRARRARAWHADRSAGADGAVGIRYARDLVAQGYVGEVLATHPRWRESRHRLDLGHRQRPCLHVRGGRQRRRSPRPTMHALDALQFVLGDLADIRATSAVRRPAVNVGRHAGDHHRDGPGPSRHRRDAEERRSRLGFDPWAGTSRWLQSPLEMKFGTEVIVLDVTRRQSSRALAPRLEGGAARIARPRRSRFRPRTIWRPVLRKAWRRPATSRASTPPLPPLPPRRHARRHRAGLRACPSCASHAGLHYDRGGERHRATSYGDTDMEGDGCSARAGGPHVLEVVDVPVQTPGVRDRPWSRGCSRRRRELHGHRRALGRSPSWTEMPYPKVLGVEGAGTCACRGRGRGRDPPARERVAWVYAPGSYAEHVIVPAAGAIDSVGQRHQRWWPARSRARHSFRGHRPTRRDPPARTRRVGSTPPEAMPST